MFQKALKFDLVPMPHASDRKLRPREIKSIASVFISVGSDGENKYPAVLIL